MPQPSGLSATTNHHTPDAERRKLAGDEGVWFFIAADISLFAVLFAAFMYHRYEAPLLFEQSRQLLSANLGVLNTLILLTSSWLVALAVHAARQGEQQRVVRLLIFAMVVGSGFAVTKAVEYAEKIQAGLTMVHNDFFMFYWTLTGLHFLHFIIGMLALGVCVYRAKQGLDSRYLIWLESSGCYWHMVDLLWIILFPMIYLLRLG